MRYTAISHILILILILLCVSYKRDNNITQYVPMKSLEPITFQDEPRVQKVPINASPSIRPLHRFSEAPLRPFYIVSN